MASSEQKKIKYKYKFKDDYNPHYVNGAHGGVTPYKEILVNFFLERLPLPKSQEYPINPDNTVGGNSISNDPPDLDQSVIRYVQSGIILNYERAKVIHEWLGKLIDQIKPEDPSSVERALTADKS